MDVDRLAAAVRAEHLYRSVVPILAENSSDAGVHGSGCLFARDGKHFLVTAAHVGEHLPRYAEQIGVPSSPLPKAGEMWTLGRGQVALAPDEDVAVFRMDQPEVVERLRTGGRVFLTDANVATNDGWSTAIVFGWPEAQALFDGATVTGRPLHLQLARLPAPPSAGPMDLHLEWPTSGPVPKLQGISGSPIWALQPVSEGIWHPSKELLLVGVQHHVLPGEHVRGTRWPVVERLLRELGG